MSELQKTTTALAHLYKLVVLQGHITLEQLNEHKNVLTVEEYQEFYTDLDSVSLIKLVKDIYIPGLPKEIVTTVFITDVLPTLLKRLEQQQTEIDRLKKLPVRRCELADKLKLNNSEPF